jgi:thiol-disulfide isomerase/thioredoxin
MSLASEGNIIPEGILTTTDNSEISIAEFRGYYIVIDFWATWCAPCIEEAPIFKRLAVKFKEANVKFISISLDEDYESWKTFITKRNWSENQYWFGMKPGNSFLSLAYREAKLAGKSMVLISLPKYLIISPTGVILNNSNIRPSKPGFEKELLKYL